MKIFKFTTLLILKFNLSINLIYGQSNNTSIQNFLQWRLNTNDINKKDKKNITLPSKSISLKILKFNDFHKEKIKSVNIDSIFNMADIDTINKQIKYWNKIKTWNRNLLNSTFINPVTLSKPEKKFLSMTIPIFTKNMKFCLFEYKIDCHQNYCHFTMFGIYQKISNNEWKLIKIIHKHTS